jgi:putative transcriptional regulator
MTLHSQDGGGGLNNRLADFRKERGVTQEELADALEVSRQTISSIENGRYNPSIVLAFKIARFFQTAIEQIFIYDELEGEKDGC